MLRQIRMRQIQPLAQCARRPVSVDLRAQHHHKLRRSGGNIVIAPGNIDIPYAPEHHQHTRGGNRRERNAELSRLLLVSEQIQNAQHHGQREKAHARGRHMKRDQQQHKPQRCHDSSQGQKRHTCSSNCMESVSQSSIRTESASSVCVFSSISCVSA